MADYTNITAPVQLNPIGLDKPINSIQSDLNALSWLEVSYGRVMTTYDENRRKIPTVYTSNRQHQVVMPNDVMQAQSFITTISPERTIDFTRGLKSQNMEVDIAIIIWVNYEKVNSVATQFFREELKADIESILSSHPYVVSLNNVVDDDAERIFSPYSVDAVGNECLMWPFGGMRFECTIAYTTECV